MCNIAGALAREELAFLANNPFYTKRFVYYAGRRCRQATIEHIAEERNFHCDTIETLEMEYKRARRARAAGP